MNFKIYIIFFLLIQNGIIDYAFAEINQTPAEQREELKRLRNQIEKYEKEIQQKKAKEANTLDLIAGLEKEINITNSYIRNLRADIINRGNQIRIRNNDIEHISNEIAKLEDTISYEIICGIGKRVPRIYK